METSDEVNELFAAFSQFQGEIWDLDRDTEGHGYSYAQLDQLLGKVRPILCRHGLAYTQPPETMGENSVTLETWITHKSGQWMKSKISAPPANVKKRDGKNMLTEVQAIGSCISYLRRYALMSILGLAQKDDDGKGGDDNQDVEYPPTQKTQQSQIDKKEINDASNFLLQLIEENSDQLVYEFLKDIDQKLKPYVWARLNQKQKDWVTDVMIEWTSKANNNPPPSQAPEPQQGEYRQDDMEMDQDLRDELNGYGNDPEFYK